jgi:hypothetical protein
MHGAPIMKDDTLAVHLCANSERICDYQDKLLVFLGSFSNLNFQWKMHYTN